MTNSFYVELSSNEKNYEDNTVANFKNRIQLLEPLEGLWEVGLVEISFPVNWKILKQNCPLKLVGPGYTAVVMGSAETKDYSPVDMRLGLVRAGFYSTVEDLFEEINAEMQVHSDEGDDIVTLPKFDLDKITKLVRILPGIRKNSRRLLPVLSKEVQQLLGFDNYDPLNPQYINASYLLGQRPADIHSNLKTLYVYTDIAVPQYVGDSRCKLLRTVGVPSGAKYDQQIVQNYENPHYVDVLTNEFEYIEIDIKDDTNERVPFMHGRSRIKLHFRRKNV
jgi:hypothetical protein